MATGVTYIVKMKMFSNAKASLAFAISMRETVYAKTLKGKSVLLIVDSTFQMVFRSNGR